MTTNKIPLHIVIVTGGHLGDWAIPELRKANVWVGADRGALFLIRNGFNPTLALGDFDSVTDHERQEIERRSQQFRACDPIDKDLTDTELALQWALRQNPQEIVLLGALGTRLDHSLANVHLLRKCLHQRVACKIVDAHNEVMLINNQTTLIKSHYSHISLLPLTLQVTGITLSGFQYPLTDATLEIGQSLGISNALLAPMGQISLKEGELLVIQSKD